MTTPQSVTYYLDSLDENVEEINLSQKGLTVFSWFIQIYKFNKTRL